MHGDPGMAQEYVVCPEVAELFRQDRRQMDHVPSEVGIKTQKDAGQLHRSSRCPCLRRARRRVWHRFREVGPVKTAEKLGQLSIKMCCGGKEPACDSGGLVHEAVTHQ